MSLSLLLLGSDFREPAQVPFGLTELSRQEFLY